MTIKLYVITWIDSSYLDDNEWKSIKSIKITENIIIGCGFLIKETKKEYIMASNINYANDSAMGIYSVPKASIETIKEINI